VGVGSVLGAALSAASFTAEGRCVYSGVPFYSFRQVCVGGRVGEKLREQGASCEGHRNLCVSGYGCMGVWVWVLARGKRADLLRSINWWTIYRFAATRAPAEETIKHGKGERKERERGREGGREEGR